MRSLNDDRAFDDLIEMIEKRRQQYNTRGILRPLTPDIARSVVGLWREGRSQRSLAREFELSTGIVQLLVRGKPIRLLPKEPHE